MTIDRDPLDVLAALAPSTVDADHLERLRARTVAIRTVPRRRRRRRSARSSVVATLALALSAGGVGLATADDPVPSQVLALFATAAEHQPGSPRHPVPDPATAQRIAGVPFDDDHEYALWAAQGTGGTTCLGAIVEPTSDGGWTEPGGSILTCGRPTDRPGPSDQPGRLDLLATSKVDRGLTFFMADAGSEIVRATIRFPDGSARDLLAGGGSYYGWIPAGMQSGVVTAYLADGSVADTATVHG